jgi:hypothetical protein
VPDATTFAVVPRSGDLPRRTADRQHCLRAPALTAVLAVGTAIGLVSSSAAPAGARPAPTPRTRTAAASPAPAAPAVPLPGGRPSYVVSIMGGSLNSHWVRLAEYTFTHGTGDRGTVRQSYWIWYQSSFTGNASRNKVSTGYRTTGCAASCQVRTPRGFQPGQGPMSSVIGRYYFDRYQRLVIEWPGRRVESWTVRTASQLSRLALHHTTLNALYGDGFGSLTSLARGSTASKVAAAHLMGVERSASYEPRTRRPVQVSRWNLTGRMRLCRGAQASCLFYTSDGWRSALVVPPKLGRRAFWQHQRQGVDGERGACFGTQGGHTIAMLQVLDDQGRFVGFVGAEASLNNRARHNAVIAQLVLA